MKKIPKLIIPLLFTIIFTGNIDAQESAVYREPQQKIDIAIELYHKKDIEASSDLFQKLLQSTPKEDELLRTKISYYLVLCSIELQEPNVKDKIERFIEKNPAFSQTPMIYYQLGRLEFKNRKYEEALDAFKRVNPSDLSKNEEEELFFRTGYCYLKMSNPEKAKEYFGKIDSKSDSKFAKSARYYKAHIEYLEADYDDALTVFESLRKDRTYKKAVPFYIIQIYYHKGEYDKILELGPTLMDEAKSSRKSEIARLIGDAYYQREDYKKAQEYFEVADRNSRQELTREEYYQIGFTYFKNENYSKAIKSFQKAISENDTLSQNSYYHLGQSYEFTSQNEFAANSYLQAYKLGFDKTIAEESLFRYVKISSDLKNSAYNESIQLLEEFIQNNPNTKSADRAFSELTYLFYRTKNYRASLEAIEKLKLKNDKLKKAYQEIAYSRGVELFNQKKYKDAAELFEKSRKYPIDKSIMSNATFWLAESFYRQNNYWGAQKYYLAFIDMKEAKSEPIYNDVHYNLGYTYYKRKNYKQAIAEFTKFVNFSGKINSKLEGDAFLRIGDCYFINKGYSNSIQWYDKTISTNIGEIDYAFYQKAQAYGAMGKLNEKDEALRYIAMSYPRSPLYDDALYELGTTKLIQNKNTEALKYYDKLVADRPRSEYAKKALLKTGLVYYNNNDNKEAIKKLKQVIDQYPASAESKEALTTLRNVYIEENKVSDYVKYTEGLEYVKVSSSEQDSLSFIAAENLYVENKCSRAVSALNNYIKTYPKGGNILKAHFYRADCLLKENKTTDAIESLKFIVDFPTNEYTLQALKRLAPIEFNDKNYDLSYSYYSRIRELARSKDELVSATDGEMESAYYLKKHKEAVEIAKKLLATENVNQDQTVKAHYIIAKTEYDLNNLNNAYKEFKITSQLTSGEYAPESLYYMALIDYKNGKYTESENNIFTISEKYASYDYWVGRGFILLADVYVATNNNFQAKQTLKSIIDNFPGENLKKLAKQKLKEIEDKKPQDKKSKNQPNDDDSIIVK
ncbi:MAG: tetratricopeptide repeat protein [Hyphomicrobiales bacterium]